MTDNQDGTDEAPTTGFDEDFKAEEGREICRPPESRTHSDYETPRWATAHVESVDNLFATATNDGLSDDGKPQVRVDLDGVGSGGASLHDAGANVNVSVWLSDDQAVKLIGRLENAVADGESRVWERDE